jgi:hypothetical protein
LLKKILLGFSLLSNIATLVGLWVAYIAAPASVQATIGHVLLIAGAITSVVLYLALAFVALRSGEQSTLEQAPDQGHALRAAEQRIANLETELEQERKAREKQLPTARPKIVPVRWGKTPDRRSGLVLRNDGELALDISIDEPISLGNAALDFWHRTYPGLARSQGELLAEACIKLQNGSITDGGALRDLMAKADLNTIALTVRYRDMDGHAYVTKCEVVNEFWGEGLRISGVRQERP